MTDLTLIARVEGVGHIWDRTATFVTQALAGAVAGAAPTTQDR